MLLIVVAIFGEEITNDIFQVEYSQKNARKAMLFSAIVPGVGQFYANPRTITAYIFPILEFGLWYGYFYYQSEGDDITKQYKDYADQHYSREQQETIQQDLIDDPLSNDSFYNGHFRLDHENTQHFYEDIGKYDKYIFGWEDWYAIYGWDIDDWGHLYETGQPDWEFSEEGILEKVNVGNYESDYYIGNEALYDAARGIYSDMRQTYIDMRQEAEDNYDKKRYCAFGLLFNHLLATIDAARVTHKYNIEHISQNPFDLKFSPKFANGEANPSLMVTYKF